MKLKNLVSPFAILEKELTDIEVNNIEFRSRSVQKGDVFVAIKGYTHDGHDYIEEAIKRGAVAVVGEEPLDHLAVPYLCVPDAREALGKMAKIFFKNPSSMHKMIGITGTNGKTTTAFMIRHILESSLGSCTLFSTVENYLNGSKMLSTATTPDTLELHRMLSVSDDEFAVMEVSSHGLDQKRVEGIEFDYGIFTNLTHDHLDYHKDFDKYFEIKSRLFKRLKDKGEAIVNSDCPWGKKLIGILRSEGIPVFTFGKMAADDLQLLSKSGDSLVRVKGFGETLVFNLTMPGVYNVQNAMAAILLALRSGADFQSIKSALENFPGVPGRFEVYKHSSDVTFIVDYAHTPDGLENFLKTVKSCEGKKIIHVFGFRGNKDVSKRELMMRISGEFSDEIILTLDDLNGVPMDKMVSELNELSARWGMGKTIVLTDRTKAIEYAWEKAEKGDHIVITGKGPEPFEQLFELPAETDAETIEYLFANQANPI